MRIHVEEFAVLEGLEDMSHKDLIDFIKKIDTKIVQEFDFTVNLVLEIISTMKNDFDDDSHKTDFIKDIERLIR